MEKRNRQTIDTKKVRLYTECTFCIKNLTTEEKVRRSEWKAEIPLSIASRLPQSENLIAFNGAIIRTLNHKISNKACQLNP